MQKRIYLSSPHMSGEELKLIQAAFESNWVAPAGPDLDSFERELAQYNDIEHCAALSSGTAAIHLALIMLGVDAGDEVICSTFTFSGSCNPIMYQRATPVFVDSEPESWNMDPVTLEETIRERIRKGKKPKAIIVVHLYGMPCNIKAIMNVANAYEIPVIEDAAEGLGSTFKGQKLGSFGTIGIYSFNGNKIITTSGGGALVSRDQAWVQKAKFLSTQARDPAPHYQHSHIGYNYRLSNISAAIGRGQLNVIDLRVQQRRAVYQFYAEHLKFPGLSFQPEPADCFSNRWLTCMLLEKGADILPEDIRQALEKSNIESRPLWKPMHLQPVFKDAPFYGNGVSEDLFSRGLCLPSGSNLSDEQLTSILRALNEILEPVLR